MKLCRDCKHFHPHSFDAPSGYVRPQIDGTCAAGIGIGKVDPVSGTLPPASRAWTSTVLLDATNNRTFGPCGMEALLFELKGGDA